MTERTDGESPPATAASSATDSAPAPVPLTEPRDGVPTPLTTPDELAAAVEALRADNGERLPIAIDAERASGYRYGQRAYLVQLRREDVGTMLIDPVYLPDLSTLGAVIAEDEWVLHAASQDLPCLAEVGLHATRVFDTELAGRLLGYAKVGLGSIVEEVLGLTLEKGHSAADWSTRPLPEPWIRYAALDVEVLVELRDRPGRRARRERQARLGRGRVRRDRRGATGHPPGRPLATYVGNAPGTSAPRARRRPRALGAPGRGRPAARHLARSRAARPGHRRGRARRADHRRGARQAAVVGRSVAAAAGQRPGCRRSSPPPSCPTRTCRRPRPTTTGHRRRAAGASATPLQPPGCRPPGRPSSRSPSTTTCPSRTCSPPMRCGG